MKNDLKSYKIHRKDFLLDYFAKPIVKTLRNHFYEVEFRGTEKIPKDGPLHISPKHSAYSDIPFLGLALYENTGKYSNFIMKKFILNGALERLGGVLIKKGRQGIIDTFDYIKYLYSVDEIVTSFPEGGIYKGSMGEIRTGAIKHAIVSQKEIGKKITILPAGLKYSKYREGVLGFFAHHSPLIITFGEPKIVEPELPMHKERFKRFTDDLREEITYLSGM